MKTIIMVVVPVCIGVIGQFFLKHGMSQIGTFSMLNSNLISKYFKILTNPFVFSGMFFYFASALMWLYVLSRVELSFAYPLLSMSYVLVMLGSFFIFKENISLYQWVGVLIIMVGVGFIGKN